MDCCKDKIKFRLKTTTTNTSLQPDCVPIRIGNDCLHAKIVEADALKVNVCEVVTVNGGTGHNKLISSDLIADIDLGVHRIVSTVSTLSDHVTYASNNNLNQYNTVIGITKTSVLAGRSVEVIHEGIVSDSGWNWHQGPIFLGINGLLTQTAPTSGFILCVGTAISSTKIKFNINTAIIL